QWCQHEKQTYQTHITVLEKGIREAAEIQLEIRHKKTQVVQKKIAGEASRSLGHLKRAFANESRDGRCSALGLLKDAMPAKKIEKDDSAPFKKRITPSRLAKEDIVTILFAEQLKAGIKKVNNHYHIDSTTIKKYVHPHPYEHTNSIGEPNAKQDIVAKRKKKQAEIERIAKQIF
ncbi:1625_t:CDS:2, partial [Diversispora eburnea]